MNFVHVMIAGVDDNTKIAGVARNTNNKNDINTSKLMEILKDKPSKTLAEFVDNTTQAKKTGRRQQ
jgi:galactose-1-phosphate uridylyltransferase